MNPPNILLYNPFRILGVYSDAGKKDIVANAHKIAAFSKLGKAVNFSMDLTVFLPEIPRSEALLEKALAQINLPQDRIRYALFWFCSAGSRDEAALRELSRGNVAAAESLWLCSRSYSAQMNLACLALLRNDLFGYLSALRRVIQRTEYRQDFIGAVCGSEFEFSVSELFVPAFEELLRNCPFDAVQEAVEELGSRPLSKKFAEVALGLLLRNIEKEIQQGSEADTKAWDELFAEGSRLLAATDAWVSGIAALSESNSITVQITLDKLAARILVCATQFYDEDESDERYDQAESMMKRALEIAVGEEQLHDCEVELERLRFSRILAL